MVLNKIKHLSLFILLTISSTNSIASDFFFKKSQLIIDLDSMIKNMKEYHPSLFANYSKNNFHKDLDLLKKTLPDSMTAISFYYKITQITAKLKDGHTYIRFPIDQATKDYTTKYFPVKIAIDPNKHCLIVMNDFSDNNTKISAGAVIDRINGISGDALLHAALQSVCGETNQFKIARINHENIIHYLSILSNNDSYSIEYSIDGVKKNATLNGSTYLTIKEIQPNTYKPSVQVQVIDSSLFAILTVNRFSADVNNELLDPIFTMLQKKQVKNLIIDIRDNGGGRSSASRALLRYLINKPYLPYRNSRIKVNSSTLSDFPNWTNLNKRTRIHYKPEPIADTTKLKFNGTVYLLTSSFTYSAACEFTDIFKKNKAGIIIGEETGGRGITFGATKTFSLPNTKLNYHISTIKIYSNTCRSTKKGIQPDINIQIKP